MVDDENIDRGSTRFQLQPKLLFQDYEDQGVIREKGPLASGSFRPPLQVDVEASREAGLVQNPAFQDTRDRSGKSRHRVLVALSPASLPAINPQLFE
jgi:hypothetical protein